MDSVKKLEGESIKVFCDSRLVVGQVQGEFEAKDQRMWWYLGQVKQLQASFGTFTINQVSRSKNTHANSLATLHTSIGESLPRIIVVESLSTSSHDNKTPIPVSVVHIEPSWMDLVVSFIKNGTLLKYRVEAKKIQKKASRYWLSEKHKLYKRSYLGPYLLCIYPEVVEALLE